MQLVPTERLLTSGEAADEIGISRASLQRWARDGQVKPAMTTPGGQYRWRMSDLRRQLGMSPEGPGDDATPPFAAELADAPRHPDEPS